MVKGFASIIKKIDEELELANSRLITKWSNDENIN